MASEAMYGDMTLRPFQREVLELARDQNVVMVGATGIGKTFVAIALLNEQDYSDDKRAFFLAPTRQLVLQITAKIQLRSNLRTNAYCGSAVDLWDSQQWQDELRLTKVCVCTPEILRNILEKGYLSMERINLLVFDECHHVSKRHPYAHVIKRYDVSCPSRMPRIFGTTACPTKTCADKLHAVLKQIDLEDKVSIEYAASAPILYETYDDTRDEMKARQLDDREDLQPLIQPLMAQLEQFKVIQVFAKLLQKTRSEERDDLAKQQKKLRNFLTSCVTIHNSLGLWCFFRFVELEITRMAVSTATFAIPGTRLGMDKDAMRTALLLAQQREECNFACTPKLHKVLQLLDERFFGADTACDHRWNASDEMSSSCSEDSEDDLDDGVGECQDHPQSSTNLEPETESQATGTATATATATATVNRKLQGIIFAKTRIECRVLTDFLNEKYDEKTKSWTEQQRDELNAQTTWSLDKLDAARDDSSGIFACVLGQAGRSDTASFDLPNSKSIFHNFEQGKVRVLVSTSVSVEGVDFPMCGLVLVTHEINSARKLIQLRGRARHEDGVVFYLGEANTPSHRVQFLKLMHEADRINRLDFSQDKIETIFQKPRAEMAHKLLHCGIMTEDNRIHIASTGAVLDLDSSISCLNLFCQSLPRPLVAFDPKTLFAFEEELRLKTKVYKAICRLPEELELEPRSFESDWSISKATGKAAAAFLACQALLKCGLLDSQLNSVYRKAKSRPLINAGSDELDLDFFLRRVHGN